MQGNDKVIEHLNKILSNELRAINQYFLHSRMLSDWGLDKFAQYEYGESMDEMKHCLLYTSPSPRDCRLSRMPSSA